MSDNDLEKALANRERIFYPGVDKPVQKRGYGPPRPVRGLDPAKDPSVISGWEMEPSSEEVGDESSVDELPKSRDQVRLKQKDFFNKVDVPEDQKRRR